MKKNKEITLNEYISTHFRYRNLDNVVRKWFHKKDKSNPKKSKKAWDAIIKSFFEETER